MREKECYPPRNIQNFYTSFHFRYFQLLKFDSCDETACKLLHPSHWRPQVNCHLKEMPSNFSQEFYQSILEASERGELWGIENSDLTPLEVHLILCQDIT